MFSLCTPLGLHYLCGLFFRRVLAGVRQKGDTLKLEVYKYMFVIYKKVLNNRLKYDKTT